MITESSSQRPLAELQCESVAWSSVGNMRSSAYCGIHCMCCCMCLNICFSPDEERNFVSVFWGITSGCYGEKHEAKPFQSYLKPQYQRQSSCLPVCAHIVVFICNYSVVSFAQIWVVMKCSRFLFHFLKTVISFQCSLSSPANCISIDILMS